MYLTTKTIWYDIISQVASNYCQVPRDHYEHSVLKYRSQNPKNKAHDIQTYLVLQWNGHPEPTSPTCAAAARWPRPAPPAALESWRPASPEGAGTSSGPPLGTSRGGGLTPCLFRGVSSLAVSANFEPVTVTSQRFDHGVSGTLFQRMSSMLQ